jgi:hypothetical protein
MTVSCDEKYMHLLRARTQVKVRNGNKAKFWIGCWLNGQAPKEAALSFQAKKREKHPCPRHACQQSMASWTTPTEKRGRATIVPESLGASSRWQPFAATRLCHMDTHG